MLILTRKEGEGVKIGDDVYVKVIECSNGSIKLGFSAPPDKIILRDELESAVKETNIKASSENADELLTTLQKKIKS